MSEFKLEDDRDVHVVIHTLGNPEETMIVELAECQLHKCSQLASGGGHAEGV